MYQLRLHHDDVWTILDERDDEVFRGALAECEAWLDAQENGATANEGVPAATPAGLTAWLARLWRWMNLPSLLPSAARSASKQVAHHS